MIRALKFSPASRMHHGFAWVSIFCFTSVVNAAVSQSMQLQIRPQVTARCGENVTLMCNFSSLKQMDVQLIKLSLLADNKTEKCEYKNDQADGNVRCESTDKDSYQTLAMILTNIMPVSEGKYLCKVATNVGVLYNHTYVKVQDCSGSSDSFRNASHAVCSFSGIHPSGVVHWFWEDNNITNATITQQDRGQHGLYNILSTIREEEDKLNYPYKCLLWIPSLNKYLSSQEVTSSVSQKVKSSESQEGNSSETAVKLHWICIVVEILMLNFRM
ncbi:uncharacterized protein LOC121647706 [Melanotaenia boesemani]|uniref:uncharacterized protein LOC121647706 n=1 Tax=Melanotaenia boesemani TaxID=1250792 RepID=UPI001C051914|nr:uncharacterized protein LOC121647706 [Melanotaenia boesemani]